MAGSFINSSSGQAVAGQNEALLLLTEQIRLLNEKLSATSEQRILVQVENGDSAIHDLVSRVLEELLLRVRQENLLRVING